MHDIGYYDPVGRLQHAASQDTDLSCHVPVSIFCALCDHNPPTLQTDGGTDGRHARSISAHAKILKRDINAEKFMCSI